MRSALARLEKEPAPLRGVPILVQHKAFFLPAELAVGLKEVGSLEAKAGAAPSSAYLAEIVARQAN